MVYVTYNPYFKISEFIHTYPVCITILFHEAKFREVKEHFLNIPLALCSLHTFLKFWLWSDIRSSIKVVSNLALPGYVSSQTLVHWHNIPSLAQEVFIHFSLDFPWKRGERQDKRDAHIPWSTFYFPFLNSHFYTLYYAWISKFMGAFTVSTRYLLCN